MINPRILDQILLMTRMDKEERIYGEMDTKYGTISKEQFEEYKKQLHGMVHWLLLYKEKEFEKLDDYFSSVLFKINGLNSVMNYPSNIMMLLTTLEAARLENEKEDCDYNKYRKAILDAHSIIDKIGVVAPEDE